jgi:hypothetical protein
MQNISFVATGISPLLMHSDRFANPLDPATKAHKELTGKRKKTDADHEDIAKSEWFGSLYHDPDIGIYIPGQNIDAALVEAAKLRKLGKHIKRAAMVLEDRVKLRYEGARDPEKLFNDPQFVDVRGVKVAMAKLMRCRPRFNKWSIEFSVILDEELMNPDELRGIVADAGRMVGLCDYRPRFGKFTVENV